MSLSEQSTGGKWTGGPPGPVPRACPFEIWEDGELGGQEEAAAVCPVHQERRLMQGNWIVPGCREELRNEADWLPVHRIGFFI